MLPQILQQFDVLSSIERARVYIVLGFSSLVGMAFLVSLGSMVYFRLKDPKADISLWVNVFLTCLGYVVGILTGLLGIPAPAAQPVRATLGALGVF